MNEFVLKQYYADSPPTVVKLTVEPHFSALTEQQKLYAHHISRLVPLDSNVVYFRTSLLGACCFKLYPCVCSRDFKWKATRKGQNSVHASLTVARTNRTLLHAIRGTKTIISCLLVIKSGKTKSGGDRHALTSRRSM